MTPGQIESNYMEAFNFLETRKRRQVAQLVLLNNLQRGDQNIASTLLLTLFNRVLSALYDDKLQVKFLPSQGITQDQITSYNVLAQSDYQEMNKSKLDYDWVWDTLFFGRGYMETYQFDKKQKIMKPHVINPLVFGYDPYIENPADWRYYYKWVTKDKNTLKRLINSGKITGVSSVDEITSGVDSYLWQYKTTRDAATKAIQPPIEPAANDVYQILEYAGYDDDGNKCFYWVDKDFSKILMTEKLDLNDVELEDGQRGSKWPIVVKESFRIPHSSVPFSIADLLEDKHRAKSVLLNLAFIAAKDTANPLYGYNPDKVKDITQFFSRQINQHIPMEDAESAWPLNTKDPMPEGLINFMTALQAEANDPIGTGVANQPDQGGQPTATGKAIDQQLNDMAQSLQSKVLQFGEAEFWSDWFHRYAKHAPELKEKMANIVGVNGVTSTTIDMKDFVTDYPPGVLVFSAKEAEYKELVLRRDLMQIYPELTQTLGPDGMRNFNKYVFFPKFLNDPSLVDIMLPKTIDELKAEQENEMLKQDQMPPVAETDNHQTHIYIHHMVQPKTWATWFHLMEHEEALAKQQQQAMIQAQLAQDPMQSASTSQPGSPNQPQTSPMAAASPLKDNAATTMSSPSTNQ